MSQLLELNNLLKAIPKDVVQNIQFRSELHGWLAKDKEAQKYFLHLCLVEPEIAFDLMFWIHEPRGETGKRNLPFILRPKQRVALSKLKMCIESGRDIAFNKSREEGATELQIKYLTLLVLLTKDASFIIGSRNQDLVDLRGDPETLFAKIDYTIEHLPEWMKSKFTIERSLLHFRVLQTGSSIDGGATTENFGAGKRATAVLLDEFGRVAPPIAQSIKETVSDISNCIIYSSTHFYGTGHAFNRVLQRKGIEIALLPWYDNPAKNAGLYKSPKEGDIDIVDFDYYIKNWPELFGSKLGKTFNIKDFENLVIKEAIKNPPSFKADGCKSIPGDVRSLWHDKEEDERDYRDLCQNIWMSPTGASDQYFDPVVINRVKSELVKPPSYSGDIRFEVANRKITNIEFIDGFKKRLLWWGDLFPDKNGKLRPAQNRNYVIGFDISFGTGDSNSVAEIYDVNTSDQIGEYVTSNHSPEDFGDVGTALALWIGGRNPAFLIWENNGGQGTLFGKRIIENGISFIYTQTSELTKQRTRGKRFGWHSSAGIDGTKQHLLAELKAAIREGLKTVPEKTAIKIHSEEMASELNDYIFYESGEVGSGENVDESSGARARHGDRIIAAGLCVLGCKEQFKAVDNLTKSYRPNSFAARYSKWKAEQKSEQQTSRRYLY